MMDSKGAASIFKIKNCKTLNSHLTFLSLVYLMFLIPRSFLRSDPTAQRRDLANSKKKRLLVT
jgi:hypothetical protein